MLLHLPCLAHSVQPVKVHRLFGGNEAGFYHTPKTLSSPESTVTRGQSNQQIE